MRDTLIPIICARNVNNTLRNCKNPRKSPTFNKATVYPIPNRQNTTTSRQATNKETFWRRGLRFQHFTMDLVYQSIVTTSSERNSQITVHNRQRGLLSERKAGSLSKVLSRKCLIGNIPPIMNEKLIMMATLKILSSDVCWGCIEVTYEIGCWLSELVIDCFR